PAPSDAARAGARQTNASSTPARSRAIAAQSLFRLIGSPERLLKSVPGSSKHEPWPTTMVRPGGRVVLAEFDPAAGNAQARTRAAGRVSPSLAETGVNKPCTSRYCGAGASASFEKAASGSAPQRRPIVETRSRLRSRNTGSPTHNRQRLLVAQPIMLPPDRFL